MRHGMKTILVAAGIGLCGAATAAAAPGYKHYVVGNPADVATATSAPAGHAGRRDRTSTSTSCAWARPRAAAISS